MKDYKYASSWNTKKEADKHAKSLRRAHYGVRKKRVYSGIRVIKTQKKFAVYYKESKGYHNWLRTGKG